MDGGRAFGKGESGKRETRKRNEEMEILEERERQGSTWWCQCGKCVVMDSEVRTILTMCVFFGWRPVLGSNQLLVSLTELPTKLRFFSN